MQIRHGISNPNKRLIKIRNTQILKVNITQCIEIPVMTRLL